MFFCASQKEAKKRIQKLNELKNLVEAIEEKMPVPCSLICCPQCCASNEPIEEPEPPKESPPPMIPPDIMVCYKTVVKTKKNGGSKPSPKPQSGKRLTGSKSRELRASILYQGCDCEKKNGLQDDCRRTGCHGSPECLTQPEPICGPSEFSNGKHLFARFGHRITMVHNETCPPKKNDNDGNGNEDITIYYNCYPATVKC